MNFEKFNKLIVIHIIYFYKTHVFKKILPQALNNITKKKIFETISFDLLSVNIEYSNDRNKNSNNKK